MIAPDEFVNRFETFESEHQVVHIQPPIRDEEFSDRYAESIHTLRTGEKHAQSSYYCRLQTLRVNAPQEKKSTRCPKTWPPSEQS